MGCGASMRSKPYAADFLSGHVELTAPTGSCVIYGAGDLPRLLPDLCEEEGD